MSRYKQNYSLYKRGKYWYYRTYTPDGLRTSGKSTGCTLKSEAKHFCENLYLSGDLVSTRLTFRQFAQSFFDDSAPYVIDRADSLAANTLELYRYCLNKRILPYFQNMKISDIKYTTLKDFRSQLIAEGSSVSTVNTTMRTLKQIITFAFRDRLINHNPFDYLDSYKKQTNERDAFSLEEVKLLVQKMPEEFKNFTLFLALTGMRVSEAVGVTEDDIVRADNFIYINLDKQFNKNEYKPLKGKTKRTIPITAEVNTLKGFNPIRLQWYYKCFYKIKDSFENAQERNLCFHSLRHFFITNSKVFGINPLIVETVAGHSLKGIEKTYTNFKTEDLVAILEWQSETLRKLSE